MPNRQIIEVGLVLMGLLLLTQVIVSIPGAITMFSMQPSEVVPDPTTLAWVGFGGLVVYGLVGFVFLLTPKSLAKTLVRRLSAEKAHIPLSAQAILIVGLILLGVYFVVSGLTGVIREIYGFWFFANTYNIMQFAALFVQLVLGLFLVLRPSVVLRLISVNKAFKTDA